jgi:hypothetical protein
MEAIINNLLGLGVIIVLIALYGFVTNLNRKSKQQESLESCSTSPTGGCCGNESACSFEARVKKVDSD